MMFVGEHVEDVVEKVFAHRSSKKASAFSCPTRDRIDAVDHFISPKSGPRSLPWDFFNNVKSACATSESVRGPMTKARSCTLLPLSKQARDSSHPPCPPVLQELMANTGRRRSPAG